MATVAQQLEQGGIGAVGALGQSNYQTLKSFMDSMGLGALFTVDSNGNPGGWLWQQLKSGVETGPELQAAMEQTDVWKDRFAVIVEQRKRQAAGKPVQVMSTKEVIDYEETAAILMRQYGMPSWFYDQQSDFNDLILNGIAPNELGDRIRGAYNTVANVSPEIKQTFREFYGPGMSDAAIAAYFLDPEKTQQRLDQVALSSYAGGIAKEFNLELKRSNAELFSDLGYTDRGVSDALGQINAMTPVFTEGFTETQDLTANNEGFDATVRGDGNAQAALERRILRRRANGQSSAGGGLLTQEGLTGAGTAS